MSLNRDVFFKEDAIKQIIEGINVTANAVKSTLGPKGQNVFIEESEGRMIVTKDGVTVARNISFGDKLKDVGSQIVKDASERTNKEAGDGTTTAAILAQYLVNEGFRYKAMGFNAMEMQKGMDAALEAVEKLLKKQSKPVKTFEEMKSVALISSNNDEEISDIVAKTLEETGKDGVITIEKWEQIGLRKEVVKGIKINNGLMHPLMINDYEKSRVDFAEPAILMITDDIQTPSEIVGTLEKVIQAGKKQVVIIAPEVSADVLGFLLNNRAKGVIMPLVLKTPSFGDFMKREMEDLAYILNGQLIGKEYGCSLLDIGKPDSNIDINIYLGKCDRVISTFTDTIISGARGDVDGRIEMLKLQLENQEDLFSKEKIKDRIAKLKGGVAVIRVGGDNAKDQKERHYRVEDAVLATRAAMDEGIVPGGGVAYLNCWEAMKVAKQNRDYDAGVELVRSALLESIKQLCGLSNLSSELVLEKIKQAKSESYGYDFRNDEYKDLLECKIIDPVKVARLALRYAIASAKLFLTNSVVITINDIKKEKV